MAELQQASLLVCELEGRGASGIQGSPTQVLDLEQDD